MRITTPTVTLPTLPTWDGRGVRPGVRVVIAQHGAAQRLSIGWQLWSRSVYRHLYPPARNQPAPVCTARLAIDLERRLQRFPGYDSYKKKKNQKKEKKTTKNKVRIRLVIKRDDSYKKKENKKKEKKTAKNKVGIRLVIKRDDSYKKKENKKKEKKTTKK